MKAAHMFESWHRMGYLGPGALPYVRDDFGTLVQLSNSAHISQVHFTVGAGALVDEAEMAFELASQRAHEARMALRKAEADLLAALPPKVAQ